MNRLRDLSLLLFKIRAIRAIRGSVRSMVSCQWSVVLPLAQLEPLPPPRPLPLGWKIAIAVTIAAAIAAGIYYLVRTWRSWNLFDRQYRFPPVGEVPIRLGAAKSGGLIATIQFESQSDAPPPSASENF